MQSNANYAKKIKLTYKCAHHTKAIKLIDGAKYKDST